jgi:hypothetical protein
VVLPGGLGTAIHTAGGQVVYPNTGAGFDLLAENTATGTRTVARIPALDGVRMVTTFVRTPADTVMLAHTNGYLSINRATATAETIGMFSPAETRDATGKLVPSSYIVKQLAPQLYALAEIIDPHPDTTWPVYIDPPLHLGRPGGAPLPQGLFDSLTNTVASVTDTVTSAAATAASATVSGAKTVGTFVKDNPLESALLVGSVAVALTGVGGPASLAMISAATVNLSSAAVDVAAAALPDNQALGIASTVLGVASMATPQGAAKKAITDTAELATEQLTRHADDIIDATKTTPTPPTQLANEVAAAGAPKPPLTPGATPKAPNAPPAAKAPEPATAPSPAATPRGPDEPKGGVYVIYDQNMNPRYVGKGRDIDRRLYEHAGPSPQAKLEPGDSVQVYRTGSPTERTAIEQRLMNKHGTLRSRTNPDGRNLIRGVAKTNPRTGEYERASKDYLGRLQRDPEITRLPDRVQRRLDQQVRSQGDTDQRRTEALNSAREANQPGSRGSSDGASRSGSRSTDKEDKKPKKKSSQHHKKPSGK